MVIVLWLLVNTIRWCDATHFDSENDYTAQVVETSVTVNNNSPIQDYVHPDDQTQPTFEMNPGFKPFTKKMFMTSFRSKL